MKINVNKILFILFILFQVLVSAQYSRDKPQIISLKNESNKIEWIYEITKDNAFILPEYNDSGWKKFEWGIAENNNEASQYSFRSYIKIDSTLLNKPIQFSIGQLGASEIFLDGKKIDQLGEFSNSKPVKYAIKKNEPILVSFGDTKTHVLAVRYHLFPLSKLGKTDLIDFSTNLFTLRLIEANEYYNEVLKKEEKTSQYSMLIVGFFLALAFIHFLLFLFYRKALYNLFFALYNASISYIAYIVIVLNRLDDPELINENIFKTILAFAIFNISLSGFVNVLFAKRKLRYKIFVILNLLSIALYYFNNKISAIFVFFSLFYVVVESFFLIIRAIIRKQKEAYIVGGGILTFLGYIVILILSSIFDFGFQGYRLDKTVLSIIVLISFPLSISAYLAWQFGATNLSLKKQLDEVNRLSEINLQQEQEKQNILQNQNELLEKQVDERTQELKNEKQKTENLLLNILPQEVADELKDKGSSEAKYYDEVSVLFTDFVSFTQNSEKMGAEKMLKELNDCFTAFDMIMEKHGLEKIKTIGDAYMAVCGLPHQNPNHAYQTVSAALDITEFIENRKKYNPDTLDIRIGVNSGALIAGIVGVKKFAYDIWGDTVNTAARMEQNSQKGKVNISESTYQMIKDRVQCEYRGKIEVKGKGELDMYFAQELNKD